MLSLVGTMLFNGLTSLSQPFAAMSPVGFISGYNLSSPCPAVTGNIFIDNFRLYPENADWDPVACELYIRYVTDIFNVYPSMRIQC